MENIKLAYSEVYAIINLMSYNLRSKIPSNFIKLILSEKDDKYIPRIERDIPLEEQNLKKETISILAFLKLNCFCNEEEKKAFMTMLSENELNFQKYLNEKYNVENLFKNKVNKLEDEYLIVKVDKDFKLFSITPIDKVKYNEGINEK